MYSNRSRGVLGGSGVLAGRGSTPELWGGEGGEGSVKRKRERERNRRMWRKHMSEV